MSHGTWIPCKVPLSTGWNSRGSTMIQNNGVSRPAFVWVSDHGKYFAKTDDGRWFRYRSVSRTASDQKGS